jgi:hypothetical protein
MQDDCEGMSDDVFSEQTQISEVPAVNGDWFVNRIAAVVSINLLFRVSI